MAIFTLRARLNSVNLSALFSIAQTSMRLLRNSLVLVLILVLSVPLAAFASSFVAGSPEDVAAIEALIRRQANATRDTDAEPDLDWENAFGIRYTDRDKRDAFYNEVVTPQMADLTADQTLEIKVKFLDHDLAVADEYWHIAGQVYAGETKAGPDRWGRTTTIFRRIDGRWREILSRVADLRIPYFHHFETMPEPVRVDPGVLQTYAGSYQYEDKPPIAISSGGDRLIVKRKDKIYQAIPTSDTEFLVFDPNDLAEYSRYRFYRTPEGAPVLDVSYEDGSLIRTLKKTGPASAQ
jgi:hypothetical protein